MEVIALVLQTMTCMFNLAAQNMSEFKHFVTYEFF